MAGDTPSPDRQEEDPSRNNPLWHDEFMDLSDPENFYAMEASYESMEKDIERISRENPTDPGLPARREEFDRLTPLFIQAYNYHYDPDDYRPELINLPPVKVQSATPPERSSPAPGGAPAQSSPLLGNPIDTTRLLPGRYVPVPVGERQAQARKEQGELRSRPAYDPNKVQNAGPAKKPRRQ